MQYTILVLIDDGRVDIIEFDPKYHVVLGDELYFVGTVAAGKQGLRLTAKVKRQLREGFGL